MIQLKNVFDFKKIFVNAILIAYLNTCTSVLIDRKYCAFFSDSKQILDQNKSVGSGDYRESPKEKNPKF